MSIELCVIIECCDYVFFIGFDCVVKFNVFDC